MCDHEYEDDFFEAWESMLDKHGLQENNWLKFIFEVRGKWAMVLVEIIFAQI